VRLLQVNRAADEADNIVRLLAADGWRSMHYGSRPADELSAALAGQSWDVVIAD